MNLLQRRIDERCPSTEHTAAVRHLNDAFRQSFTGGRLTAPDLMKSGLDPRTRETAATASGLQGRVAPHLDIGRVG